MFVLHVLSVDINISYVNVKIHRTLINGSLTCKRFDHMHLIFIYASYK